MVFLKLNDDYYECLTPASTIALLEACKAGKPPKMGRWGSLPMNGQVIYHHLKCHYSSMIIIILSLCPYYRWHTIKVSCEGPQGKTSLFSEPPKPGELFRKEPLEPKVLRMLSLSKPFFSFVPS
jgi:NADH dehydrogenase (ubiquinone) flavoprotein 2